MYSNLKIKKIRIFQCLENCFVNLSISIMERSPQQSPPLPSTPIVGAKNEYD